MNGESSKAEPAATQPPQVSPKAPQYVSIGREARNDGEAAWQRQAAFQLDRSGSKGEPVRLPISRGVMILPEGCAGLDSKLDVLVHFHGALTTTEPRLMQSGIRGVYVVQNLGNFSGPYENAFGTRAAFGQFMDAIVARVNAACSGRAFSLNRVALSGWSAGYGAIYRIIAHEANADRVDAVLLADGMHVGFEPGSKRLRAAAMQPFLSFAERAARGEKLMAVTHSQIEPPTYASTSATAGFLAAQLGLPELPATEEPRENMHAVQHREKQGLALLGFAGADAKAHCDHLYAIQDTLWSRLRDRWSRGRS